jgi:hypothetical protein
MGHMDDGRVSTPCYTQRGRSGPQGKVTKREVSDPRTPTASSIGLGRGDHAAETVSDAARQHTGGEARHKEVGYRRKPFSEVRSEDAPKIRQGYISEVEVKKTREVVDGGRVSVES